MGPLVHSEEMSAQPPSLDNHGSCSDVLSGRAAAPGRRPVLPVTVTTLFPGTTPAWRFVSNSRFIRKKKKKVKKMCSPGSRVNKISVIFLLHQGHSYVKPVFSCGSICPSVRPSTWLPDCPLQACAGEANSGSKASGDVARPTARGHRCRCWWDVDSKPQPNAMVK